MPNATLHETVTITRVEDAMLQSLRAAPRLRQIAKTIDTYQGQLETDVGKMVEALPALYVMFEGSEVGALLQREQELAYTFVLIVCATSLRDRNTTARRGAQSQTGTYTLLQEIREVLIGSRVGIEHMPPFWLQRESAVLNTTSVSIYTAQYTTRGNIIPRAF